MTVYALMTEQQVEGEFAFMVESLHATRESANAEAKRQELHTWHFYIEPMEVQE